MDAFIEGIESFVVFHDAKGEIVHVQSTSPSAAGAPPKNA